LVGNRTIGRRVPIARCHRGGDCAVRKQAHESEAIALRISKALHDFFASVLNDPVPERWVDLIIRLNEEERQKREVSQKPTRH
jgi:hypothetical protein